MKIRFRYYSPASKSTQSQPFYWNRFLCWTQTNRIKTVIIERKTLIQALFESPAMLFKLIHSPARSAQITLMKSNLTRENTYLFKLLNKVSKQNTSWNVKRDKSCRENTAIMTYNPALRCALPLFTNSLTFCSSFSKLNPLFPFGGLTTLIIS